MRNRHQELFGRRIRRNRWGILALSTGLVALTACQTDSVGTRAVSLEEAKQITADFSGSFTPPPKSINDILSPLAKSGLDARDCAGAPEVPDETWREMMQDLPPSSKRQNARVRFATGLAELAFRKGNYQKAVRYQGWAIDTIPSDLRAGRARHTAILATYHAYAGDFDAADSAIGRANGYAAGRKKSKYSGKTGGWEWFQFHLAWGRAAIEESQGDLILSEARYRQAMQIARETPLFGERIAYAEIGLAMNLMRQGRLVEAETRLRNVLQSRLRYDPSSLVAGSALVRLGEIVYEQGRYDDAEALARATIELYHSHCAAPESLFLTTAQNVLGKSLVAQERWQEALDAYDAIETGMAGDRESFRRLFAGTLYRALALLQAGRAGEASEDLGITFERSRKRLGETHYKTAEIRGFLAMALLATGDKERALREFETAVEILLTQAREADDEDTSFKARDRRLALILGAYIGLLADIRDTALAPAGGIDPVAEGFRLAEVARSQAVQRALAASGARAALKDPALADLARREQDAQKQITVIHGTLAQELKRPFDEQSQSMIGDLMSKIDQLRGARAALMEEIETRFPAYANLITPRAATITEARAALRPGEALIATYVGAERSFVWAVPHQGAIAFATAPLGQAQIARAVADLRRALDPKASTLGEIPDFDVARAQALYLALLAPVKAGWGDAQSLLVVAHRELGQLPFSVLVTGPEAAGAEQEPLFANYRAVSWLARSHAVSVLPSVASLVTLRALPPGNPNRRAFAGFADPWFSDAQAAPAASTEIASRGAGTTAATPIRLRSLPETETFDSADLALLPRLPDTVDEVRGIALALGADPVADLFLGKAANEDTVKTLDLTDRRVLAFATHGLVPGDLDGLSQPALALSAPSVVGGGGDGLLTMGEILGLDLDADWVVLSACNTASAQGAGSEAVSGLGRAFFYAGTRALLVSNWPVETTSAKALTTDLFRRQAKNPSLTREEALRRTMLALIDGAGYLDSDGRTVFSYAHPIFWAPFTLVGDGGGGTSPGS